MARPSKLTDEQCSRARTLRTERHIPVPRLAKQFKVSESSMYKVLDGSYHARPATARSNPRHASNQMPQATPNLFPNAGIPALGTQPGDDVVLEAARLIVSRSRFAGMLRN